MSRCIKMDDFYARPREASNVGYWRKTEVVKLAAKLQPITNPNMKSDLTTAVALAKAAIEGALANVEINLDSLKDDAFVAETRRRANALRE